MSQTYYLMTLEAPGVLEELVVDCLLSLQAEQGFNSYRVNQHHHIHSTYSLAEQMHGYQQKLHFQMRVSEQNLLQLQELLGEQLTGTGIHYWVVPVLESGVF